MSTDSPKLPVELENKILALQEQVIARAPGMPTLLQEIWIALKKQPENVTLLTEENIQIIVSGLEVQTNNKLVEVLTKNRGAAAGKKLKALGVDDL